MSFEQWWEQVYFLDFKDIKDAAKSAWMASREAGDLHSVLAAVGPFSDHVISNEMQEAVKLLQTFSSVDAVKLVLRSILDNDSVIGLDELTLLAVDIGVFDETLDNQ